MKERIITIVFATIALITGISLGMIVKIIFGEKAILQIMLVIAGILIGIAITLFHTYRQQR